MDIYQDSKCLCDIFILEFMNNWENVETGSASNAFLKCFEPADNSGL